MAGVRPGGSSSPVLSNLGERDAKRRSRAGPGAAASPPATTGEGRRTSSSPPLRGRGEQRAYCHGSTPFEPNAACGSRRSRRFALPFWPGFDCFGQTVCKPKRPNGRPAKLQSTPSKASGPALRAKRRTLGKQAKRTAPAQLLAILNPILRGWANSHRHVLWGAIFPKLDTCLWQRG